MKKALITGFTGQVGSQMADFLIKNADFDVHGMMRWQEPLDNIYHLTRELITKRLFICYGDLNDYTSMDIIK